MFRSLQKDHPERYKAYLDQDEEQLYQRLYACILP